MKNFEGYTFEEFEQKYGCKPYSLIKGHLMFLEDLIWFSDGSIDIDLAKIEYYESLFITDPNDL